MNVDGGVGNVEMIGKHFHSLTIFFIDVIFKHRYIILNSITRICYHYQLKFAEIIPEKNRAGFQFAKPLNSTINRTLTSR